MRRWIVGINGDGWPEAIPLDRVDSLRVDPADGMAVFDIGAESGTMTKCCIVDEAELHNHLAFLAIGMKEAKP